MNLAQFGQQLNIQANTTLPAQVASVLKEVSLAVQAEVVMNTPVDTGNAKSNWQVSLNSPITSAILPYAYGRYGSTASVNEISAVQQAQSVLANLKHTDTVYICNNIHYIQDLNSGWSSQAPDAFVERAIQVGVSHIPAAANNVKFSFR